MLPYHIFPYTNFHEINIDWLLQKVKGIEEWINQFNEDEVEKLIKTIINGMVKDGTFDEFFTEWVEPINTQLTDLTSRVVVLETTQATQDTAISNLRTDLNALTLTVNTDLPNIFTQLDDLNADMSTAQNDITTLQNGYTVLNTDYATFKVTVANELADHESRISALENVEPVRPKWQTRNFIYGGSVYATANDLFTAIENGNALIGDNAPVTLTRFDGMGTISATVFVGKYYKDSGAFLIVKPDTLQTRNYVEYDSEGTGMDLMSICDTVARRNVGVFNNKLSLMSVEKVSGGNISVIGMSVSAPVIVGYPEFVGGYYQNGKFPFIEFYLTSINPILLSDDDGANFAVWRNDDNSMTNGVITRKDQADINTSFSWAFVVRYN